MTVPTPRGLLNQESKALWTIHNTSWGARIVSTWVPCVCFLFLGGGHDLGGDSCPTDFDVVPLKIHGPL